MTRSCPHCDFKNRDTAQFCAQCAQPLRQSCPECNADNPPRSRYCRRCGASLAQELTCPQCNQNNPAGSSFCNACGGALSPIPAEPSDYRGPRPYMPVPGHPPTATSTGELPPQTVLSERYIILRQIGTGGMGAVYQADDARIPGKTWAVKEMSDAAITTPLEKQQAHVAFRQEALMLASLDHTNLPKVTDHFTQDDKQYLVMDFIDGETLADRLEREYGQPLALDLVLGWAEQLCNVLEYLHSQDPPVIFRDLKPSNVMITSEGMVKLIDFGIARIFKPGKATDTAYFGTAGYSPREQYGRGQTDARSDIYALGAMLHHLLTGVDPVDQPFCFEDVQYLNDRIPVHTAEAIMKALSDDPADRWQSAAEMKAALTQPALTEPESAPTSQQSRLPESQVRISAAQPAMVAASEVGAVAPSQSAIAAPRLNHWYGLGLALLGGLLYGAGTTLAETAIWELGFPVPGLPTAVFSCIPALFGMLFGPWVGGFAGALGPPIYGLFTGRLSETTWALALACCAAGVLPGLMVKDARTWKQVIGAGVTASGAYALAASATVGTMAGWLASGRWDVFGDIAIRLAVGALPANVVLLPFLARWFAGWASKRGLYWRDLSKP
jgi:serine/threonine-protein kinase